MNARELIDALKELPGDREVLFAAGADVWRIASVDPGTTRRRAVLIAPEQEDSEEAAPEAKTAA